MDNISNVPAAMSHLYASAKEARSSGAALRLYTKHALACALVLVAQDGFAVADMRDEVLKQRLYDYDNQALDADKAAIRKALSDFTIATEQWSKMEPAMRDAFIRAANDPKASDDCPSVRSFAQSHRQKVKEAEKAAKEAKEKADKEATPATEPETVAEPVLPVNVNIAAIERIIAFIGQAEHTSEEQDALLNLYGALDAVFNPVVTAEAVNG